MLHFVVSCKSIHLLFWNHLHSSFLCYSSSSDENQIISYLLSLSPVISYLTCAHSLPAGKKKALSKAACSVSVYCERSAAASTHHLVGVYFADFVFGCLVWLYPTGSPSPVSTVQLFHFTEDKMGLLASSHYVLQSTTVFILICIALYYCLTGRGQRAGDIGWLLEGKRPSFCICNF